MTGDSTGDRSDMSLPAFAALLNAYGAAPERWPEAARGRAVALLAASAEARAMQAETAALDDVLDVFEAPSPPAALRETILAAAPRQPARRRTAAFWPELLAALGGWRPAGAALAASLALGIASGGVLFEGPLDGAGDEIGAELTQLALFDDNFAGY